MGTNKPCILRIISDILLHQAALADYLAHPQIQDLGHRKYLHSEILRNQADFQRLVAKFQMQIEPRS